VAEQRVGLGSQRGKLRDGQGPVDDQLVATGVGQNRAEKRLFAGASDEDDPGAQLALDTPADFAETLGWPEAEGTSRTWMYQQKAGRRGDHRVKQPAQ
jgi:hypothetical protein